MSDVASPIVSNADPHGNGGRPEFFNPLPEVPAQPAAPEVAANRMEAAAGPAKRCGRKPGSKNKPKAGPADGATEFNFGANVKPDEPARPPEPPVKTAVADEIPDPFDPARYRRETKAAPLVKKTLTACPLRKPSTNHHVRTHPALEMRVTVGLIELELDGDRGSEVYLVDPTLDYEGSELTEDRAFRRAIVVPTITRGGSVYLMRVMAEAGRGGKDWYSSGQMIIEAGAKAWIRIKANMELGCYEFTEAMGNLPEPKWPEGMTMRQLLTLAFKDRLINSLDHPIARQLRGEV
jgi:hypothetical protein